jgi:hypothetical protein
MSSQGQGRSRNNAEHALIRSRCDDQPKNTAVEILQTPWAYLTGGGYVAQLSLRESESKSESETDKRAQTCTRTDMYRFALA